MKSPLSRVKEQFGDKAKLLTELQKLTTDDLWVNRANENKGLEHVSNSKLLRLHTTLSTVKEKFGTREKLIDAILELLKRTKDDGFKAHLAAFPVPRLYDLYRSTAKRIGGGSPKPKPAPKAAKPAAAKPAAEKSAKAAPAKKPAKAKSSK